MQKPSSLPSLRERSEVLDRRIHWETQETPVAQSHLSASVCITGYRHSGCRRGRQESIFSPGAEPATRLLGRQHSVQCSLRANEPSQLPSKYRFQVNTLNSAQRMAQPAEEGGACQPVLTGWVYDLCPWFLLCLFQACTVSTTTDCVMVCEGLDWWVQWTEMCLPYQQFVVINSCNSKLLNSNKELDFAKHEKEGKNEV